MVDANLDGLRQYLCEYPGGLAIGQDQRVVSAYPYRGDPAGTAPGSIVGIDGDNDGILDYFVGKSPTVLSNFLGRSGAYVAKPMSWGLPVKIPRSQVMELTSHCQQWAEISLQTKCLYSAIAMVAGGVVLARTPWSLAPVGLYIALAGVCVIGVLGVVNLFSYYNTQPDKDTSEYVHSVLNRVLLTTPSERN